MALNNELTELIRISVEKGESEIVINGITVSIKKLEEAQKALDKTFITSSKIQKENTQAKKGTEAAILAEIAALTEERKNVAETSIQYGQFTAKINQAGIELDVLRGKALKGGAAVSQLRNNSGLASQTLVELGRTVSDSNYGFTAMANNLSQLGYYMTTLVAESGGFRATLRSLGRQLLGAGGVVIALQVAIALFEKWSLSQRSAKREADSLASAVGGAQGLTTKLRNYKSILDDSTASAEQQEAALRALKKDGYDPLIGSIDEYLDAREKVLMFNALESVASKKLEESLAKEFELRKQLADDAKQFQKDLEKAAPMQFITGTLTDPNYIRNADDAKKEMTLVYQFNRKKREEELASIVKERTNLGEQLRKMVEDITDELGGNSFFCLLFGDCKGEKPKEDKSVMKRLDDRIKSIFDSIKDERELVFERRKVRFLEQGDEEGFLKWQMGFFKRLSESQSFSEKERLAFREKYLRAKLALDKLEEKRSKEAAAKRKQEIQDLQDTLQSAAKFISSIGDILDSEYQRQITLEKNKTNVVNNELKERLRNESLSMEERKRIQNQIAQNDEELRKKQLKIEEKKFKANKAIQISTAIVNTAAAAVGAAKDTKGDAIARIASMVAIIGAGLAQVAIIARQKFSTSAASMSGGVINADTGGGGQAEPSFNIVGQSGTNQLARAVQSQLDRPIKTYVVAKDVSTSQEMDRNVIGNASLG